MTETTVKTQAEKLAELKKLLGEFDVAAVKALLKATEAEKPTLLSLSMDAIFASALAGPVIMADVTKAVTISARAANVIKETEEASATNVAQLIRYARAYDAALSRAGFEIAKKAAEGDSEPASTAPSSPATPPASEPQQRGNSNRRAAA